MTSDYGFQSALMLPPKPTPSPLLVLAMLGLGWLTWWDARRVDARYQTLWAAGVVLPVLLDAWLDPFGGAPGVAIGIAVAVSWLILGRWRELVAARNTAS